MKYAIKYFDEYELINQVSKEKLKRVIYISTDDNKVIQEAKHKYIFQYIFKSLITQKYVLINFKKVSRL